MINIYLGIPTLGSQMSDDIDAIAINWGISYESAVNKSFDVLVNSLGTHDAGGSTYFDLLMCDCFRKKMSAPKIKFNTHGDGIKLPMLTLKDWAIHEPTNRKLPLTNQMVNHFGEMFSDDFEIEYLGYERARIDSTTLEQSTTTNPYDVVYMINNKPHIHNGHEFILVDAAI